MKFDKKIKKPTKDSMQNVELTITLDDEDVKRITANKPYRYEGKIYTTDEINAYVREVLEYSDLPDYWRKPINDKTKTTMENLLALQLFGLITHVNLAHQYGMKVYKEWSCVQKEQNMTNEDACPICEALNGIKVPIEEPFPSKVYIPKLDKTIRWNLVLRDKNGRTFERPVALMNHGGHLCSQYGCRCGMLFDVEEDKAPVANKDKMPSHQSRTRQRKGHSLILWIFLSFYLIGIPFLIYYSVSPDHYWHA